MSQREQVKITLPSEVTRRLDELRGDASRSSFVEGLITGLDPPAQRRRGSSPGVPGMAGNQPAAATPKPKTNETPVGTEVLGKRNGLLWADFDDVVQRAVALGLLAGADRNDWPPVFFFRSSLGQSPGSVDLDLLQTAESAWAYNDRF